MSLVGTILIVLLQLYSVILVARLIIEMIQSFSRSFRPPRWFAVVGEFCFVITDPPVRALRKLIPPLRTGAVALDLSVIVLFFILQLLMLLVQVTMLR